MDKNGCLVSCECYLFTWNWDDRRDSYICSKCGANAGAGGWNDEHGSSW